MTAADPHGDPRLWFLGTGASGGTPGAGRSRRRESSALASGRGQRILLDATRDADQQLGGVEHLDAVLLTHGHRDACGGIPALRRRLSGPSVTVAAAPETIAVVRERYARLDHCDFHRVEPGTAVEVGSWRATACEVAHARSPRFRTYAWRLATGGAVLVYASDVADLADDLREFAAGADLLVLDGAMYGRSIFSHLRIDEVVPVVCGWDVGRILLTQIGRTAPEHDELERVVADMCARAAPAHDGLTVVLDGGEGTRPR